MLGFLVLLAWDAVGLDLPISRLFGGPAGFPLRDDWLFERVLHDGVRTAAWALAAVLAIGLWRPLPIAPGLGRREIGAWLIAALACAALIPALKHFNLTSCPWSLAEFGGTAMHVSHWRWGQGDGGPGQCFPAGHATAAFCFLPAWFVLRGRAPRAARVWLAATLVGGIILTMVQVVRGAHFVSHSLWTAWCCWAVGVATEALLRRGEPRLGRGR